MKKQKRWPMLLMGSVAVLMLALIGGIALAQDATPETEVPAEDTTPDLRGFGHWEGLGRGGDANWLSYLAEALGISVDELEDAQARAYEAAVADAVTAGQLTQEQADAILARQALKSYIDRQAILATALGMTTDELETALNNGQSITDLMVEKGIDTATLQANAQAAYEAALQQAVTDGVITQAQADTILSSGEFGLFGHGGRGGHFHGGRGGHGGRGFDFFGSPDSTTPGNSTPETTDTSFDA